MAFNGRVANAFVSGLLQWNYTQNNRQMPWKKEKDPYKIWLSEVILQQTKVEQGLKYYNNFISSFPNISSLASAEDATVFKHWQGLGYYSRCKNLIATARFIDKELKGIFPNDYLSILKLKGVGSYTAAAIGSFAFDLPFSVLDGNVFRVLARIFNIEIPVDIPAGKKLFAEIAQKMLPKNNSAVYNQAIMDFGAVICKPSPQCPACFFSDHCIAHRMGTQNNLPAKEKKIKPRERWLNYFIFKYHDEILIHQRTGKDVWQHLYEFFLLESDKLEDSETILKNTARQNGLQYFELCYSSRKDQRLTHQIIHFHFMVVQLNEKKEIANCFWVPLSETENYAFPQSLKDFIVSIKEKPPSLHGINDRH